jgi:hypothetical protein
MTRSTNFFGFEDADKGASILLITLPADAYAELDRTASADVLKQQGMRLERREALSIPLGKAFLLIGQQEFDKKKVRKWVLVSSAPSLTAMVTVQIPETANKVYPDATIRSALATVSVRDSVPVNEQLDLLPFRIGEFAGFHLGAVIPGRAAMLTDAEPTSPEFKPQIFIGVAPGGPTQGTEREPFARDLFASIPDIKDVRIASSETLRILGQPGHQILAQAVSAAGPVVVVQWLRFGGGVYMQLIGISPVVAWQDTYPRFRSVRDGVEPR